MTLQNLTVFLHLSIPTFTVFQKITVPVFLVCMSPNVLAFTRAVQLLLSYREYGQHVWVKISHLLSISVTTTVLNSLKSGLSRPKHSLLSRTILRAGESETEQQVRTHTLIHLDIEKIINMLFYKIMSSSSLCIYKAHSWVIS